VAGELILGDDPDKEWSVPSLAQEVQAESQTTTIHLTGLKCRGLVTSIDRGSDVLYRHGCGSPALERMLCSLLQLYRERPVTMIRMVYAQASETLRVFADAFRVRKEK
jgi:hypothetical protein